MSETPDTPAGRLTDRIMMAISGHILPSNAISYVGDGTVERKVVGEHHYNRAWEKVHEILSAELGTPAPLPVGTKQCGKLVGRAGSIKRCTLLANHEGRCVT